MKKLLPVIVMTLVMFFGSMYMEPEKKVVGNESVISMMDKGKPVSKIYEELMNEDSKAQYEKMQSQMDDYLQKKEERHRRWMLLVYVCAAIAIIPVGNMFIQLLKGNLGSLTVGDMLYIFSVCIGTGILVFLINLGGSYLMFFAERSIQVMVLAVILFGGGAALWIASFRTKKKNQRLNNK